MKIGYLISDLDQLEDVAAWGYDYAEALPGLLDSGLLDSGLPDPGAGSGAATQSALRRLHSSPVPVASLCGFIPAPEDNRLMVVGPHVDPARLRAYVTRVFDLMQRADIDVIGYGSGSSRWVPDGFPRARALDQVRDFLRMCDDLGRERRVRVALEPYNRDDANLLNTVPEALELVQEIDRPNSQLMADFVHMRLNREPFDALTAAGPHLIHAHIGEPGRSCPPTTPDEHAAFLRTLRAAGYDGRVTQTGALPAYDAPAAAAAALKKAAGS